MDKLVSTIHIRTREPNTLSQMVRRQCNRIRRKSTGVVGSPLIERDGIFYRLPRTIKYMSSSWGRLLQEIDGCHNCQALYEGRGRKPIRWKDTPGEAFTQIRLYAERQACPYHRGLRDVFIHLEGFLQRLANRKSNQTFRL